MTNIMEEDKPLTRKQVVAIIEDVLNAHQFPMRTVSSPQFLFATDPPAGGKISQGILLGNTKNFGIFWGSGAPTLSAAKGSLYLRTDGSSTSTRLYVNSDSSTSWVSITTAS